MLILSIMSTRYISREGERWQVMPAETETRSMFVIL
jgi:hypothetical protein